MLFARDQFVEYFRTAKKYQNLRHNKILTNLQVRERPISVVTTCMNRLHDLKQTLPDNLQDNYGNVEFVLLDYNSCDGLGDWISANLMEYIKSGRLVYYRTECSEHFKPNHSRNISFRLAKNSLIANVDADNFMGYGFLKRLNQCATVADRGLLIVPDNFLLPDSDRFFLKGRFALYRDDIYSLGGFDEDLDEGFSHDDVNFVLRAMMSRYKMVCFESSFTSKRIHTTDEDRVKHVENKNFYHMKRRNAYLTSMKLSRGIRCVNDENWGKAEVQKNFGERYGSIQLSQLR